MIVRLLISWLRLLVPICQLWSVSKSHALWVSCINLSKDGAEIIDSFLGVMG